MTATLSSWQVLGNALWSLPLTNDFRIFPLALSL
jgi:hypothetical protein